MARSRHTVCKATTRALTKHRRRLTAVLLALLLGLAIASYVSYQVPVGDNVNVHAPDRVSVVPFSDTSSLGAGSERDYLLHRPDGHGNTVRVAIAVVSTDVTVYACYAVASAYFADLPVVLVGFGERYKATDKVLYIAQAANLAGLDDSDVVLALDGDIMFTGQDMLPYIDRFIAQSAPSPCELDAKAVREGRAMAPSVYSTELNCFAPQTMKCRIDVCMRAYDRMLAATAHYYEAHGFKQFSAVTRTHDKVRHLNTGASLHRVWSLRLISKAIQGYTLRNVPACVPVWNEDQSIVTAVYLDLRHWEVERDMLLSTSSVQGQASTYGLYAGQIQLDITNRLSGLIGKAQYGNELELTTERWNETQPFVLHSVFTSAAIFYRRLRELHKHGVQFTDRQLTRFCHKPTTIKVAPPVVSTVPRYFHDDNQPPARVYPLLLHYAGSHKETKLQSILQKATWYLPMLFDKAQWEQGRDYLLSMPMELWNTTTRVRVRYADVCPHHPFSVRPTWD